MKTEIKTYSNRYSSITKWSDGTFTGFNKVSGVPACEIDPADGLPDFDNETVFKSYDEARLWQGDIQARYSNLERAFS
jgi:hypothetical protein